MDGSIAELDCRYRVLGDRAQAGATASRLDRLARQRLPEVLSDALDQVLGDDPTVYLLRHVRSQIVLDPATSADESLVVRRWGEHLAGAVVRAIAQAPGDGLTLVRFDDWAAYVAHFVADLVAGQAGERWYYARFDAYRSRPKADALRAVLLDQRAHLPAILGRLARAESLEAVLDALGPEAAQALWSEGLGARPEPRVDPEPLWPLFRHAVRLADRLALWSAPGEGRGAPALRALYEAYLAAGPPLADWRDPRGLAHALLDVLRFLRARGALGVPAGAPLARGAEVDAALVDFDWLDVAVLRAGLLDLIDTQPHDDLPLRAPGAGPTPRQRRLLETLAELVEAGVVALDRERPDSPANALRLYAALSDRAPAWAGDALAADTVQRLLSAWVWLVRVRSLPEALRCLEQGDTSGALQTLPPPDRALAELPLRYLARLGAPGARLVRALAGGGEGAGRPARVGKAAPTAIVAPARPAIESRCAGVYLLLRAALDARLGAVAAQAGYPVGVETASQQEAGQDAPPRLSGLQALLVALCLRWAGAAGTSDGEIDPGLAPLAGRPGAPSPDELRQAWAGAGPADHARFQAALLRVLGGQRLASGQDGHLFWVPLEEGGAALVAGDGDTYLWPLGRIIEGEASLGETVAAWLEAWRDATGRAPRSIACDARLWDDAGLRAALSGCTVLPVPVDGREQDHADHRARRAALLAALSALEAGRLGLPGADLTLALAAGATLRVWARWLRRFAGSSVPYLLEQFVRRPGWVTVHETEIEVALSPRPLDVVLEMAGYTAELEQVPWLGRRTLRFCIQEME